jgi:hypothetical protein
MIGNAATNAITSTDGDKKMRANAESENPLRLLTAGVRPATVVADTMSLPF